MSEPVSRISLIIPATKDWEHVRQMVLGMDWVLLETECDRYASALEIVAESKPDGVIVSLDDEPTQALQLVAKLGQVYPRLPIIVISGRLDRLVQAHRRGARSLVDFPVQLEDLSVALRNLSTGTSLHRPPKGQIIAFLSSRGGVGTTSLAINLGCTLEQEPHNRAVLIDLDLATDAADVALDLVPEYRLGEVDQGLDRMDLNMLTKSMTRDDTGLLVLPRPMYAQEIAQVTDEYVQRLITLLRITSSHVLLDLSKSWRPTDVMAMQLADFIFLVVQTEMGSVRNAVLLLRSLEEEGLLDKVCVVMNRVGADFGDDSISLKKAEEVMARQVPNDARAVMGSWNAGQPLVQFAPKSKVQQSIAALAGSLSGLPRQTVAAAAKKTAPGPIAALPG